jgi:septal ring factor EnvC (AmiA/AmiB activator)
MGWARTLFLGDIGNRLDIADTEDEIRQMQSELYDSHRVDRAQDARLAALEQENDELKLYLASLVRLLVSRGVLTEEELRRFVDVIDGKDER